MKRILIPALLLGAVVVAARVNDTKNTVPKLQVVGSRLGKPKISLLRANIPIELDVMNPTSSPVNFEYYAGNIVYSGANLASFSFNGNNGNYTITPRTTTTIKFDLSITNLNVLNKVKDIVMKIINKQPVTSVITIDSTFFALGRDLPVKFSVDLKSYL